MIAATILHAEQPIITHNLAATRHVRPDTFVIRCDLATRRCVIRAYRHRRPLLRLVLDYRRSSPPADMPRGGRLMFEDYSGWITYRHRTYLLDVPCQAASPCVDG